MPGRTHLTTDDIGVLVEDKATNVVIVNVLSDLPTPSGGKITLAANTLYQFQASINIGTNYLESSDNTSIEGVTGFIAQIVYTGTGGAIRGTDCNFSMESITVVPAVAGGKCWDFINVAKTKTIYIKEVIVSSQNTLGVIDGFNIQYVKTCNFVGTSNGIQCKGGNYLYLVSLGFDATNTGTFIDIPSGSWIAGQTIDCTFNVGATHTAFNLNSAATFSAQMLVQGNVFTGAGNYYTGHDPATYYDVEYKGNTGVANSVATASMSWSENLGTMTLASTDGWKKIIGMTSVASNLFRFSHTSPNRLTYVGKKPITVKINFANAVDYESGSSFVSAIGISKNGTFITDSDNGFTVYSVDEPCSTNIVVDLVQNDYIESVIKKFTGASTTIKSGFGNMQINELS